MIVPSPSRSSGQESATETVAYWTFQVLFWGAYVGAGLAMILPRTGPQPAVVGGYTLFFFYSIALTHSLRCWVRKGDWLALSPGKAAIRLLSAALLLGAILTVLVLLVQWAWTRANVFASTEAFVGLWVSISVATLSWTAVYVGAASLLRARRARQNAIQLELDMREARLKALEAQIGPHFLFNCLNTLRGLIVENPTVAQDIVTRLANILRHNLSRDANSTEPLSRQVEFTTDYLALESVRFEERLKTKFAIDSATLPAEVPAMLLQTLVENAIKHGISHLPDGGEVSVSTQLEANGTVHISVENTGRLSNTPSGSTRVGLANLRERLRVLHGAGEALTLAESNRGTVIASVRVPHVRALASP